MTDLSTLYRKMYEIRKTEELIQELFDKGVIKNGTVHLCIGQEAVSVGVSSVLDENDVVFSNHRGHGHMLARGLSPRKLIYEILGKDEGQCSGLGGSQHICAPEIGFMGSNGITGGAVPIAVGYAMAKKLKKEPGISVVYFGDGASSQGVVHEAMNMAAIWKLPILFVYENNKYAMSSPSKDFVATRPAGIWARFSGYGMHGASVSGMDVLGVEMASYGLVPRIKGPDSLGPSFLICDTYRFCGHSKSDLQLYRKNVDVCHEKATQDPVCLSAYIKSRRQLEGSRKNGASWADGYRNDVVGPVDVEINDIRKELGL
jgi:TPP-dependent pyruvate/acetoin dehydrogenase alpha subunit